MLNDKKIKKIKPKAYDPTFINTQGKKYVVVGGGNVALRKIKPLFECGARVTVISPRIHPNLSCFIKNRNIHWIGRGYRRGDLKGAMIVVAATDEEEINRRNAALGSQCSP